MNSTEITIRPWPQPQQSQRNQQIGSNSTRKLIKARVSPNEPPAYDQLFRSKSADAFQTINNSMPTRTSLQVQRTSSSFTIKEDRSKKFGFVLKQIYSHARTISKFGLTGVKDGTGGSCIISDTNRRLIRENDLICSNTNGILKPCRSCFEGQRCNQLGAPRCRPSRQITQYTLSYAFTPEQHIQNQRSMDEIQEGQLLL